MLAKEDPKEVFVRMLSDVRGGAESMTKIFQELSAIAQDEDTKETLNARVFVSGEIRKKLDECFRLLGETPVRPNPSLHGAFIENFRREIAEMQSPEVRRLFILSKVIHLLHLRVGEYVAMIAAADLTGHYAVGLFLESCVAEKLVFIERTQRLIRERVAQKLAIAA